MQIFKKDLLNKLNDLNETEIYEVEIEAIVDAGINPREVDAKYAEQISQSIPPILLGIIDNDEELKEKLIIIDGNHRLYSYLNVHDLKFIPANIKRYKNKGHAIIDAYKFNMSHGKRLSEKEIDEGIKKTIQILKTENNEATYKELCKMLNITKSGFYEYIIWDKVCKILKCDVEKNKANKMNILLKDVSKGEENLKLFWELNKNLKVIDIKEALKHYKTTGEIVDWEKFKVRAAILSNEEDDGLKAKPKTITKINDVNKIEENENKYEDKNDHEIFELDDIEETDIDNESILSEELEDEEIENEEKYTTNNFVANNAPIEEGRKIEISKMKEAPKDSHLVSVPGLVRKYSFETVMNNVFEELTEGVITSQNSLNEVLENNLHDNRQMFESKKNEYLRALDNVEYIIKKMRKALEKANKDFKE